MELPTEVTLSIDGDEYLPESGKAGEPGYRAAEKYGDAYAGAITVRFPSVQDSIEIGCRTTAAIQVFEVRDATSVALPVYQLVEAIIFFAVLAKGARPGWLDGTARATPKAASAIIHAHKRALAELEDGKKKSGADGATSSAGT